jgi:hypothetical protein
MQAEESGVAKHTEQIFYMNIVFLVRWQKGGNLLQAPGLTEPACRSTS